MSAALALDSGAASQDIAPDPTPKRAGSGSFDYFNQIFPSAPIVCGLELKPLSIGRYRRMRHQNIAFVADEDANATAGDLLKGVLICSMTCDEYDDFISSPDCEKEVRKWGERVGLLPPRYKRWGAFGRLLSWIIGKAAELRADVRAANYVIEQAELFQKYIQDAQIIPNYTKKQNSPAIHTIHWSNSIELHLRSEQNWTTQEINEAPLSKALADYFGHATSHGLVSLLTDKDVEDADNNAKALDALADMIKKAESVKANG